MKRCPSCGFGFQTAAWTCPACGHAPPLAGTAVDCRRDPPAGSASLARPASPALSASPDGREAWKAQRLEAVASAYATHFPQARQHLEMDLEDGRELARFRERFPHLHLTAQAAHPDLLLAAAPHLPMVDLLACDPARLPHEEEFDTIAARLEASPGAPLLADAAGLAERLRAMRRALKPKGGLLVTATAQADGQAALLEALAKAGFVGLATTPFPPQRGVASRVPRLLGRWARGRRPGAGRSLLVVARKQDLFSPL